jgi:integrase
VEHKEITPLTDEQVKKLLEVCENEDYGNIYKLIVFTGLREGEALGLTWDCVDFDKGVLKINKQLQRRGKTDELVSLKNSKPRYLTVPPFVLQLLREQNVKQLEARFKAQDLWQGFQTLDQRKTALVFTKADGTNITAAAIYQRYKHIAKAIGAPESRVHDLRHTYAVLALQNGDSHKTLQDNLGHATAAFTLTVYGHTSERMREESASKMQQFIESVM